MDNSSAPKNILDQTFDEVIRLHPQAQQQIMHAMHISQEQFKQLLDHANNNALMHMKLRDLFSQGIIKKALEQNEQVASSSSSFHEGFLTRITKLFKR